MVSIVTFAATSAATLVSVCKTLAPSSVTATAVVPACASVVSACAVASAAGAVVAAKATEASDSTLVPSDKVATMVIKRPASAAGRSNNTAKSPTSFAVPVATSAPFIRIDTFAPAGACPKTCAPPPLGSSRKSKLGDTAASVSAGAASVSAGAASVMAGAASVGAGAASVVAGAASVTAGAASVAACSVVPAVSAAGAGGSFADLFLTTS